MGDELIDIVDENNQLTKTVKMKSEAHRKGLWHRVAHILLYTSKGEILIQLRAKEKEVYPDMWDVLVGGHVSVGENPITSVLRELEEELGLKVKEKDLTFVQIKKSSHNYKKIKNREFLYIYLLKFSGDIKKLKLQKEEVQEIKFLDTNNLKQELKNNPLKFIPPLKYWTEIINEIESRTKK